MTPSLKKWRLAPSLDTTQVQALASQLNVDPFVAELLIRRGITTLDDARVFFRPTLQDLHPPLVMADMKKAVKRVVQAIHNREKVLVYGDYDVDGTTSVAMMYSFLKQLDVPCEHYIPHRYHEGYGVSAQGVAFAKSEGCSLMITLDCGVKAVDRVKEANELGIDVIICDHHKPGTNLPPALAVLDPMRDDCPYPFKGLSGCGVGFKLIQAIVEDQGFPDEMLWSYLDLLTISIGADIVPIIGENRTLCRFGLDLINKHPRPGVRAMLNAAGFNKESMTISDVVFILAPRINAAGRMDRAAHALELLLAQNDEEALPLSQTIEEFNRNRKELDKSITESALEQIAEDPWYETAWSTVVFGADWHKGVIGIVASRIMDQHYKPTIVFTEKEGILSGSARSIEGLDIYEALGSCRDLLIQFGGHAMAAGMTMKLEQFKAFRQKFDEVVKSMISQDDLIPVVEIEHELPFDQISTANYKILKQFAPHGPANMKPAFLATQCRDTSYSRLVGGDFSHLKLHVVQENGRRAMEGIGFNMSHGLSMLKSTEGADLVYTLEENSWNGKTELQIQVRDIHLANANILTSATSPEMS
ncbi:MAG: single-stranded-DNA-specific exonuclease RecJ [Flavobacteriales bacterium]|nr:single-stranded-DNA-specific exonuclease RecJ [Flavobacteriales bacterium]